MAHGKSLDLAEIGPADPVVLVPRPTSAVRAERRKAGERSSGRSHRAELVAVHYGRKARVKEAVRALNAARLAQSKGGDAA